MGKTIRLIAVTAGWLALSAPALAQTAPDHAWSHGTTLQGFAGVAAEAKESGTALGGAVAWNVDRFVTIEGSGSWIEFGRGHTGFAGALQIGTNLRRGRRVAPLLHGGIGLYRAAFTGRVDDSAASNMAMPEFYRRRLAPVTPGLLTRTFTDPTCVFGGGATVAINRRLAVRPDVTATVVVRDRRTQVVTTMALHAIYSFEDHPVTPSRGR